MQSLYSPHDAAGFLERYGARFPEHIVLRTYTARLLGQNGALVLHGGGNTSVKARVKTLLGDDIDVIYVKGSGWDLATIEPEGHPAVRLEPLERLRVLEKMSDEEMVNELRVNMLDASGPTPSVETLLHAFLPARFIDHTHADAILSICDQPDGEKICRSIFGKGLVWVPYVMPGFALSKRCADAYEKVLTTGENPTVIVLERHGLFTFGESAKDSYERTISAVTRAERFIADQRKTVTVGFDSPARAPAAADEVLARLRGALARAEGAPEGRGPILVLQNDEATLRFLERPDAHDLVQIGCATPDHVIRTKPTALFVRNPDYADLARFTAQLENEIALYVRTYDTYFEETCARRHVNKTKLDPLPRVVLLPGLGMVTVGKTRKDARVAADIYEHTMAIMTEAAAIGTYSPVSRDDLFDVEYWSLEQAKIKKTAEAPLARCIAVVTGAASGIGRATAEALLRAGAHVAILDRDAEGLAGVEKALAPRDAVLAVTCDVTDAAATEAAVARVVRAFGGIDLVVSNAGTAPEGRLDTKAGSDALLRSLDVNLLSHNTIARAATRVMLAQGRGGCLLFNASKSAFNPGPNFGPYAVAKAGLVALMRQYAVDLGSHGIRSNAVNADRIRTALFGGGVAESRAKARGVSVDEYFRANLLSREVTAADVADAFVYLAGARATTGCVLTVDGGNSAAFPR
jgi:rhamnulose-1-phosphate aldolase/alcohol dehydrogenase